MINYSNANFVKSASMKDERPKDPFLPEVLIVGRSNVGKSSLINALCNKKNMAFTSSKPGHTKLLNYFNIDNKFYLVDAPGYGYAKTGVDLDELFGNMMNDYLEDNDGLRLILFLLDSRRELTVEDNELVSYLLDKNYPFLLVTTKMDKLNQKEKSALNKRLKETGLNIEQILQTSSLDKVNIDKLGKTIEKIVFDK